MLPSSRIIQRLDITLPLRHIRPQHPPIIRQQAIYLPLHVRSLRPHAAAARKQGRLLLELGEEQVRAVVPGRERGVDLIGLVDGVDCFLDVPETRERGLVI